MKQILKKKDIIVVLVILFSFTLTSEAAFERREDRQKKFRSSNNDTYNPNNEGTEVGRDVPVEDATPFLLTLGLIYGLSIFKRKEWMVKKVF